VPPVFSVPGYPFATSAAKTGTPAGSGQGGNPRAIITCNCSLENQVPHLEDEASEAVPATDAHSRKRKKQMLSRDA